MIFRVCEQSLNQEPLEYRTFVIFSFHNFPSVILFFSEFVYFALEILNQQILSPLYPLYLGFSALLVQPFPPLHTAHGNQDLISFLPGKILTMSLHWCKESDIKTDSLVINIPAAGDCDVLLKRKAKN